MDLGIALYKQEKFEEALKQFEEILRRYPENATALRYMQLLRNQTALPTVR
jgi:TolA-binding protein